MTIPLGQTILCLNYGVPLTGHAAFAMLRA
jgi:hypothetical protein